MIAILSKARPEILNIKAYSSARSETLEGSVFLDANESPFSPDPKRSLNRYPEPQPRALVERFAELYEVDPKRILIGRGSDEAIDLLTRAFGRSGIDEILTCPPTYGMYEVSARIQGLGVRHVPLVKTANSFALDEAMIMQTLYSSATIKLITLCSPNNPTGSVLDKDVLFRLLKHTKDRCVVVIDEAYVDFAENASMLGALSDFPHLVILRTLSKAWGLAGLRCGVALGHPELIALLQKIRAPYPLSVSAIEDVLNYTHSRHQSLVAERIRYLRAERKRMEIALADMTCVKTIFASATNFLLVEFKDSKGVFDHLRSLGLIIRDRSFEPLLAGCLRITIGSEEQNDQVLARIQEFRS